MKISVGHTPDSDDAFMFFGMLTGKVTSADFEVRHIVEDIEGLNKKAASGMLDVTAASVHACAYSPGYTILRSGGSFGMGYGPIIVAGSQLDASELGRARIAVPGRMTSAFLLLQLMIGRFDYVEMGFSDIPKAVKDGKADAGLVIHEAQLSYRQEGVAKILDVGEWWDKTTGGLPVPLGVNVMKTVFGPKTISKFDRFLQASIKYGRENPGDAASYAMQYGRGKPRDMIERFIKMYVNDVTVEMGDAGEESVRRLFEMAADRGLIQRYVPVIASRHDAD